jgi:hypothetical protein
MRSKQPTYDSRSKGISNQGGPGKKTGNWGNDDSQAKTQKRTQTTTYEDR